MMKPSQTPGIQFISGTPINMPNYTYENDNFYISYNDSDYDTYGSDTTALVFADEITHFYILEGDHRQNYFNCKSLAECIDYFNKNIDKIARFSESPGFHFSMSMIKNPAV